MIEIRLMGIYLGIDGGGTKTLCQIGDEKSILGKGSAGASNVIRVGDARARGALLDAIAQACKAANIDSSQITRACVGLAGAEQRKIADAVRQIISEVVSGQIEIMGDALITLHAAFGRGPGVIVIAGTGSVAYGRNSSGQMARAGGWGFAVSDEGSGQWIGRSALAAVFKCADEADDCGKTLLDEIRGTWGIETLDELVLTANGSPAPNFSELFPAVLSAANSGDKVAIDVLTRAGIELARLARIVQRKIFTADASVPVAMSGGVFGNSTLVREIFYNELQRECPSISVNSKVANPVDGALDMARNPV